MPLEIDPVVRRRIFRRLKGYHYSQAGTYFITICTRNRECVSGDVRDGEMVLNDAGRMVSEEWMSSADIRSEIDLDAFVVIPDHIHGVIVIDGSRRTEPSDGDLYKDII